jgi:hypothetical protein
VGGVVGAAGGAAAAGGFLGLIASAFASQSTGVLLLSTLGGAGVGAVLVGAAGVAVGGGAGYAVDVATPDVGLYQFVVQPNNELKPIKFSQYTKPLPLHSSVHILEKNDVIFIKQK